MKKTFLIMLVVCAAVFICACAPKNENGTQNSSTPSINRTASDFIPMRETVKCTIEGNTLTCVDTSENKVQTTIYSYNAQGKLISKSYKAVCESQEEAQSIYDTNVAMNKFAGEIMFENLKIEGTTVTCDYTNFALKQDKLLTMQQMKEELETAYIKQPTE